MHSLLLCGLLSEFADVGWLWHKGFTHELLKLVLHDLVSLLSGGGVDDVREAHNLLLEALSTTLLQLELPCEEVKLKL